MSDDYEYACERCDSSAESCNCPSLRDRFAMAALTGWVAKYGYLNRPGDAADAAYKLANAMLKVRGGG